MLPADATTDNVVVPSAFSAQLHWTWPDVEGKEGAWPLQNKASAEHANCSIQVQWVRFAAGCLMLTDSLCILSQSNKVFKRLA